MIVNSLLVFLAVEVGVGLFLILKKIVELHIELKAVHARLKKVESSGKDDSVPQDFKTDFADAEPFLNEKGLYSYDAYETKMKMKYDRPKNVVEV